MRRISLARRPTLKTELLFKTFYDGRQCGASIPSSGKSIKTIAPRELCFIGKMMIPAKWEDPQAANASSNAPPLTTELRL